VQTLVERGNGRLMAIMSALAFQDLTAQKIQRAFEVLEEVNIRLGKIHHLVSFGAEEPPPAQGPADEPEPADGQSGQDLADEILRRFEA
jgi:chemotaxis regulatin CheY-phosphate phosphatase CheZ